MCGSTINKSGEKLFFKKEEIIKLRNKTRRNKVMIRTTNVEELHIDKGFYLCNLWVSLEHVVYDYSICSPLNHRVTNAQ